MTLCAGKRREKGKGHIQEQIAGSGRVLNSNYGLLLSCVEGRKEGQSC